MSDRPDTEQSLEAAVTELLLAISQLRRRLRTDASPSDLNLSQLGALVRLDQQEWMTTADLARAESMKPQSMGTILSALERQGLVQRRPHPTDGRQVQFALTIEGIGARRRRSTAKRDWLVRAMARLSPAEQRKLIAATPLLKRLGDQ